MKLRTQNTLAIVPVFAIIALVGGFFAFTGEREEIRWGMEEEAKTLAFGVAAYMESVPRYQGEEGRERFLVHAKRLLKYGQAVRVALLDADGKTLLADTAEEGTPFAMTAPRRALAVHRVHVGELYRTEEGGRVDAFARMMDARGKTLGFIGVVANMDHFAEEIDANLKKTVVLFVLVVLAGLGVSFFLSGVLARKIEELGAVAGSMSRGDYTRQAGGGLIAEIDDLGNTFNTLGSVLTEAVDRAKQSVLDEEQFRSDRELARTYHTAFDLSIPVISGNLEVVCRLFPATESRTFFGVRKVENRIRFFAGRIDGPERLETAVTASAAFDYAYQRLPEASMEELSREVRELFPLARWMIAETDGETALIHRWEKETGDLPQEKAPIPPGAGKAFHSLGEANGRKVEIYLASYPELSLETILEDLEKQRLGFKGVVFIVRRNGTENPS